MSYPRFFAQLGERLIDNGYPIIPILPGDKRPRQNEWQQAQIRKEDVIAMGANGSAYDGVGIQTAYAPAVDLDIYDGPAALVMSDWIDAHIGMGLLREGQAPKRLLMFRTDTPFQKTFSASYLVPGTSKPSKVEILGAGQQFVAFGIHPDTKMAYTWPDESVLERAYWSLPLLTHEAAKTICSAFEQYAAAQGWTRAQEGNWSGARASTYSADPLDRKLPRSDVTDEQVRDALALLDADQYSDYSEWVRVGQMLHHQYQGSPDGLQIFDEWSQTLDKYEGFDAVEAKWASFNEQRNAGVVTIGSLLHEAKQIRERAASEEEQMRKGQEAFLFRELEIEVSQFTGDWFDFKSADVLTNIKRFIGNVADQSDAERFLSRMGKTVADRKLEGAPAKSGIERELKPAYRKAGAAPHAVSVTGAGGSGPVPYETNRDGAILPSQTNVAMAMRSGGYAHFGFDRFEAQIKVCMAGSTDWRPLNDNDYPRALIWLESQGFTNVAKERIRDAIALVADERSFDSAILWGNSLQWDGVARLPNFASTYLHLPDSAYHVAVWYYAWTAMAARLFEPGCKVDMVPVLVSEEGFNKSSFVEALAPIAQSFGLLDLARKDDDLSRSMRGKLVMEWAEMKGLKGRDEEAVKQFVTQAFQEWTPKWQEHTFTFYRRCFFIGTANNPDLLPAHGKNRRWLPMTLMHAVDLDAVRRDRDQLWAEAILVYRQHGIAWKAAHDLAGNERDSYREDDPLSEFISDWLGSANFDGGADGSAKRGDSSFRMSELKKALDANGVRDATPQRIGQRLRALGYDRKNLRNGYAVDKVWVKSV